LTGVWQCRTFAGTALVHEFSRGDDATSLVVDTSVRATGGASFRLAETYVHRKDAGTWRVTMAAGSIVATAAEWSGDAWTFEGRASARGAAAPFRMTFTRLAPTVYRRDFEARDRSGWQTYAGETCIRDVTR
jgi:phosphatidylserine/phosphatidylglycerophosphate/cardiolipin synthase-like enzyme